MNVVHRACRVISPLRNMQSRTKLAISNTICLVLESLSSHLWYNWSIDWTLVKTTWSKPQLPFSELKWHCNVSSRGGKSIATSFPLPWWPGFIFVCRLLRLESKPNPMRQSYVEEKFIIAYCSRLGALPKSQQVVWKVEVIKETDLERKYKYRLLNTQKWLRSSAESYSLRLIKHACEKLDHWITKSMNYDISSNPEVNSDDSCRLRSNQEWTDVGAGNWSKKRNSKIWKGLHFRYKERKVDFGIFLNT